MEWTRSETIGLATASCLRCKGLGLRERKREGPAACNCVFRTIFRACLRHFQLCVERQGRYTAVTLQQCRGRERRVFWSLKNEDYMADFLLISKRMLTPGEYDIFRFHFLLGADWNLCCRRLGMDRGNFFHAVYRIQQRLGRAFAEIEPYPIYPVDEYFGTSTNSDRKPPVRAAFLAAPKRVLRPPVRKIA
jgi:hypothetical protein